MRKVHLFALIGALALVLGACSSDDNTGAPSGDSSTPASSPSSNASPLNNHGTKDASGMTDLTIELDDNYFEPTFIKAKDGQKLSIELENEGSNPHTFTISGLNIDQQVDPGAKKEIEITFSGSNDIAFFCRFHGSGGMRGAFFFGNAPTAAGGTTGAGSSSDTY